MGEANQTAGAVQDLADERVVYALVFSCVEHHVEQLDALMQEKVTAQDCAKADSELAGNLTGILCGALPEHFKPVPGWSDGGLGKFLRTHFADEIAALDPEHRAIFEKDDEACVFLPYCSCKKPFPNSLPGKTRRLWKTLK